MRLSQLLASQIPPGSRSRGYSYFMRGAVSNIGRVGSAVHADVIGSELYTVSLEWEGGVLHASCTCRFFDDRAETCKHIWATILEAERRGVTVPMPAPAPAAPTIAAAAAPRPLATSPVTPPSAVRPRQNAARGPWRELLDAVTMTPAASGEAARRQPDDTQLLYVVDVAASRKAEAVVIELMRRDRKVNGDWGKPKPARLTRDQLQTVAAADRELVERLTGGQIHHEWDSSLSSHSEFERLRLVGAFAADHLALIAGTGRALLRPAAEAEPEPPAPRRWERQRRQPRRAPVDLLPLAWDAGPPWTFAVKIRKDETEADYVVDGVLFRPGEEMPVAEPLLLLADGIVLTRTHGARLTRDSGFAWLVALRAYGPTPVPAGGKQQLEDALAAHPPVVQAAPGDLHTQIEELRPQPFMRLRPLRYPPERLIGDVSFDYGGVIVPAGSLNAIVRAPDSERIVRRALAQETALLDQLTRAGFRTEWSVEAGAAVPHIAAALLPRVVRTLTAAGWQVEAGGVQYRQAARFSMQVTSGIDWFDLASYAEYGDQRVSLPQLLAARARGDEMVPLEDGSMGILPDEWLRANALLPRLATRQGDLLRFKPSQLALLDALLAAQPETTWDDRFARARSELLAFDGITPADPPSSFTGTLREYQREGLGWLLFLRRFGFGGCLADDMGLGKTVMVLALLARLREEGGASHPALVVAPRSLVFNWRQEASRFAPALRVLEYTGSERVAARERLADYDLVLTTYGTLRRDAAHLADVPFEYVVLDESQAIKNAASASAKAVRLLKPAHRLALSGTPIENHLGELWSLFEFLNPGLLGSARVFSEIGSARTADEDSTALLARSLRPFLLRRTKEQVAPELPERTEQTLYCELEPAQRALYDELREHYRRALLDRSTGAAFSRSKLQVLEALAPPAAGRVRIPASSTPRAATSRRPSSTCCCRIWPRRSTRATRRSSSRSSPAFSPSSAQRLDAEGLAYEYLDGTTRDRQAIVERFQTDPERRLFLISLKAGGVGLNLTAAEYVFLLDPWWNPAVEAQADRPCPPHRPDAARLRLPPDCARHRRGARPRVAGAQAAPGRRHPRGGRRPDPRPEPRRSRTAVVVKNGVRPPGDVVLVPHGVMT